MISEVPRVMGAGIHPVYISCLSVVKLAVMGHGLAAVAVIEPTSKIVYFREHSAFESRPAWNTNQPLYPRPSIVMAFADLLLCQEGSATKGRYLTTYDA